MNAPSNSAETTAMVVAERQQFDLSPRNFDEAWRQAEIMADSDMVPKDFKGKPGNCLIAVQWGAEIGLKSMQAVQNIAVINGRPSLWGDAALALVRSSPLCRYVIETDDGTTATCRSWRNGEPQEQVRTFSMEDAKLAGLLGKQGPWTQYPKRMRQMRARAFLLRDVYTDVLKGLHMAEESMDLPPPERFMGPADVVGAPPPPAPPPAPEFWPADLFEQRLPEWRKAIADKKATADAIVAKAKTKHPLSPDQEQAIRAPLKSEATDVAPKVTYAQVDEQMRAARGPDALNEAAALIAAITDPQQRKELEATYEQLVGEMNNQAGSPQ